MEGDTGSGKYCGYCSAGLANARKWQIAQWVRENTLNTAQSLGESVAGGIYMEQLRPLDISSTEIRNILAAGNSARYLMPESVLGYIEEQGLYYSE